MEFTLNNKEDYDEDEQLDKVLDLDANGWKVTQDEAI